MHIRTRIGSLSTPALAASLILMIGMPGLAQSTAVLQGKVTDPRGSVMPNATVIVRNEATSVESLHANRWRGKLPVGGSASRKLPGRG